SSPWYSTEPAKRPPFWRRLGDAVRRAVRGGRNACFLHKTISAITSSSTSRSAAGSNRGDDTAVGNRATITDDRGDGCVRRMASLADHDPATSLRGAAQAIPER